METYSDLLKALASNWGWMVVMMSWILFIVIFGIMYSYGILFVEFQAEFESSATLTGWAGSIPIGLTVLLAPPMNVIIDRFGYRPVAVMSLVIASTGVVATSFVPNMLLVYVTYSLMFGCGSGAISLVVMSLVVHYFPSKNCVRALAFTLSGTSIGMLSFAPFLRLLIDRFGWRTTLRIIGSLYFILGIPCVASFVPSSPDIAPSVKGQQTDGDGRRMKDIQTSVETHDDCPNQDSSTHNNAGDSTDEKHGVVEKYCPEKVSLDGEKPKDRPVISSSSQHSLYEEDTSLMHRLRQAMTYPELSFISVAVIINGLADCFYYVNMVSYMVSVGFTETDGARILSVIGASTAVGKITLSFVSEWLPFPVYYVMLIASVVSCVVMCCFLVIKNLALMFCLAAVIGGVMISTTAVVTYSIPSTFFGPERSQQTWPVILFCNGVGLMCGSLVGQSIDRTGSYRSTIWTFIGLYIVVCLLLIAAPLYQRTFAPKRYVVQELHRVKHLDIKKKGVEQEDTSEKFADISKFSGTNYEVVYERVSTV
ncbi:monocarboxylate transporter 9 [Strongylocentrotus purpuratus]|uniref:Major facilitator superfamily (MFS) profile domain-containing protein n=1 Tax=Strongylocentrotus purpuratus TaxID=7668 RepID=A0A7M7NVE3_STRPU|nr:monocarboxylate transporter 9 [Strongylocentrotus purpuratus]